MLRIYLLLNILLLIHQKKIFMDDEIKSDALGGFKGQRPIRVLVAKVGLDGHDRGAKVIATALRDAGMEVIYTGLRQTPEMVVNAALQEDVDAIGISILSGAHMTVFPKILQLMKEKEMTDVLLTGGGIIPEDDMKTLNKMGVGKLFAPGTNTNEIAGYITNWVKENRSF
jgi:methylmalonyl-CoA mutase C-terminal domain/subunit